MSAMEKMLQQMLVNAVPEEQRKHFTAEGLKKLGEQAAMIMNFHRQAALITIEQNKAILANQKVIMEHLNVGTEYSGGPSIGTGTGSGATAAAA